MLTIEECRKTLEDGGKDLSDEEVEKIRDELYELGNLALECYFEEKRQNKRK